MSSAAGSPTPGEVSRCAPFSIDLPKSIASFSLCVTIGDTQSITRFKSCICGYGRMGQSLAKRLQAEGLAIVVIDQNAEHLKHSRRDNIHTIVGDAANDKTREAAGAAKRAEYLLENDDEPA